MICFVFVSIFDRTQLQVSLQVVFVTVYTGTLRRHLTARYDFVRMIVGKIIGRRARHRRVIVAQRRLGPRQRIDLSLPYVQYNIGSNITFTVIASSITWK